MTFEMLNAILENVEALLLFFFIVFGLIVSLILALAGIGLLIRYTFRLIWRRFSEGRI